MGIIEKFDLSGRTAIVTGASKGIGLAIAEAFGQQGANVMISSRKQEACDEIASEFTKKGILAKGFACHMGDLDTIPKLVEETVKAFGSIDVIVNNAATNPVFGGIEEADHGAFDKIMGVNVKGPWTLCKAAYPHLKEVKGSIINISSVEGITPGQGLGLYSVSKSAIIALTKVFAREWGPYGVRANAICPGLVETKFSEALTSNEHILKHVMAKQALPDVAQPIDIAGLALLLASDASGFLTGGIYAADGGYTI